MTRILGLIAGVLGAVMLLSPGSARASDEFADALRAACAEGQAYTHAQLLDLARASYSSVARAAPDRLCADRPVDELLADIRAIQRRRARLIERARLYRLTGVHARGRAAARWRRRAYRAYIGGLGLDPVGDGARAGVRNLLWRYPSDAAGRHCVRARELVDLRLLWEARQEIARGMAAGEAACRGALDDLVDDRALAYRLVHRGIAAERGGDTEAARASFIEALATDPGAVGARAGLRRTRAPLPTESAPPQVLVRLEIGSDCGDTAGSASASGPQLPVVSRVTIRVAAADRNAQEMRLDRDRGYAFRLARDRLLRRAGLPPPDETPVDRGYSAQEREGTIDLAFRDGVAEATFLVSGLISERRPQYLWPWIIRSSDDGVAVRPVLRRSQPGSKKRAELVACGWKPVAVTPSPPSDSSSSGGDRTTLAWDLAPRPLSPRPQVTLDAPALDGWSLAASPVLVAIRFVMALFVAALLFWLARRRLPETCADLRSAAATGLWIVAALTAAVFVLYDELSPAGWLRVLLALVPTALLLRLYLKVADPPGWLRGVVLAAAGLVAAAVVVWHLASSPDRVNLPDGVVLALGLVLVMLLPFTLLSSALYAFSDGLGWPLSGWRLRWRVGAQATIVLVCLVQAVQFVLSRQTDWYARGVVFDGDDTLQSGWPESVEYDIVYQPFNALSGGRPLLLVIAAGLVLAALRLGRGDQPHSVTFAEPQLRRLVAVLFAAIAVGSAAPVVGLQVPVALGLSLLFLRLMRSEAVEAAEEHLRTRLGLGEDAGSALSAARGELLARAAAVHRELRVEADLHTKYGAGAGEVGDQAALETGLAEMDTRAASLRSGQPLDPDAQPPRTVPLPAEAPPESVALALGPTGDWWENGREAVRLAWPLIAVLVGFSVYVLIDGIVDRWSAAVLFDSVLGQFGTIVRETVFWLVSAFTLGARLAYLPFRSAALKGLALAGVGYILPLLVLELLSLLVDGVFGIGRPFRLALSDWSFRGFELLVFLAVLGVRLDAVSVRDSVARLVPLYGLDTLRNAVVYAAPVLLTLLIVGSQLFRGEAAGAVQTILENAGSFVPAGPALGFR